MQLQMYIVDAFTEQRFKGNSAAVLVLEEWLSDKLMQSIASENNLSETAFVVKNDNHFHIRWFSPITEIDFCGHATLASSFVLFRKFSELNEITFTTDKVGQLIVNKGSNGKIVMTFPTLIPTEISDVPAELLDGLSIQPSKIFKNQQAYFAIYDDEQAVYKVQTDNDKLKQLAPYDVVVTAKAKEYDFVSRYFWPANGGDEDPVTGSIHAGLAPYWAFELQKQQLVAYQASNRGGILYCQVTHDQVIISGHAVLYLEGTILV